MAFIKQNLVNIIVVLIVLGGIVYLYPRFFGNNTDTSTLSVTAPGTQTAAVGGDLLQVLSNLRSLKLDDSIFSDPTFQNLKNFRVELQPEPVGRDNPFAPITPAAGATPNTGIGLKNLK